MVESEFPESSKSAAIGKPEQPGTTRNLPWVEKYRPQKLTDLISHTDILGNKANFNIHVPCLSEWAF